jgi:hypothetical protein
MSQTSITLSSMEESISLEETNTIRVSLGLKPLVDGASPDNDSEEIAEHESKCVAPAYLAPCPASTNACSSPFRDIADQIAK